MNKAAKIFDKNLKQAAKEIKTLCLKLSIQELRQEGHTLTLKLEKSLRGEITHLVDGVVIEITGERRGQALDTGVPAASVKFRVGTGAGYSNLIQGLFEYFKKRGLADPLGKSFATAKVAAVTGFPTPGAYKSEFTSNNRRTKWVRTIQTDMVANKLIMNIVAKAMQLTLSELILKYQR